MGYQNNAISVPSLTRNITSVANLKQLDFTSSFLKTAVVDKF